MHNQPILLFLFLKALVNDWALTLANYSQLVYQQFELLIYQNFSADTASLVLSMILGRNGGLDSDMRLKFKVIGMLHVACVSGFNVGLVCAVLKPVLEPYFSKKAQGWALIASTWGYTLVAQGGEALLRAAVMASLGIIGSYFVFRSHSGERSLFLSLTLLIFINFDWLDSIGLQLSAAATWGILVLPPAFRFYCSPILRWLGLGRSRVGSQARGLLDGIAVSCSAWIATLPLVWYYFQELSWWGLLANNLLLWMVPLITVSGLIWAVFCLVVRARWLVQLTSLPTIWLTQLFLKGVDLLGAQAQLTQLPALRRFHVVCLYLFLYALLELYKLIEKLRRGKLIYWQEGG